MASRYPLIVEAVDRLKVRSCLIGGEAVACDENGLAVFARLRRKPSGKHVFLYALDLLELDGQDLRREPLATLASLLRGSLSGLRLNEHLSHPGDAVFRHACKMVPGQRSQAARKVASIMPRAGSCVGGGTLRTIREACDYMTAWARSGGADALATGRRLTSAVQSWQPPQ